LGNRACTAETLVRLLLLLQDCDIVGREQGFMRRNPERRGWNRWPILPVV
jgi:hypothetical protein